MKLHQKVRSFTHNLALAIHDRNIELNGGRILYYYDADAVFGMIVGFEDSDERNWESEAGTKNYLVRALLSCNFLGRIHILRPHARELHKNIRRKAPNPKSLSNQEAYKAKLNDFLNKRKTIHSLEKLRHTLEELPGEEPRSNRDKPSRFLEALRGVGVETFLAMEMINGLWPSRLRRFFDSRLLDFDEMGPEMEELIESSANILYDINLILRSPLEESGERRQRTQNILQDAAALTMLHQMIRNRENDSNAPLVRFYTETKPLRTEWKTNNKLRQLLSYPDSDSARETWDEAHLPPDASGIFRGSDYFIMRARFRRLAPNAEPRSIEDLEELRDQLWKLLPMSEGELNKALEQGKFQGESLGTMIDKFQKLSLMESLWSPDRLPEDAFNLFHKWTKVFDFARGEEVQAELDTQVASIWQDLENRIGGIDAWNNRHKKLEDARKSQDRPYKIHPDLDNLKRDLGLVRWGMNLDEDNWNKLKLALANLFEGDEKDAMGECFQLATEWSEAQANLEKCKFICTLLWYLGLFSEIDELLAAFLKNRERDEYQKFLPSLTVWQASAKLKGEMVHSLQQRRELVARVLPIVARAPQESPKDAACLLGAGYVLFHAFKSEVDEDQLPLLAKSRIGDAELIEWAEQSLSAGEKALSFFYKKDPLSYAFAVNHCAYVAMVTGEDIAKILEYIHKLTPIEPKKKVWQGRFADTMGYYYLRQVKKETHDLEACKPTLVASLASSIQRNIDRARTYFSKARETEIGDIDIDPHENQLNLLEDQMKEIISQKEAVRVKG